MLYINCILNAQVGDFEHFKEISSITQSCPTLLQPHGVAHQAPLSMELSRQEYWSGLPFPSSINTSGTIQLHYFLEQLFFIV